MRCSESARSLSRRLGSSPLTLSLLPTSDLSRFPASYNTCSYLITPPPAALHLQPASAWTITPSCHCHCQLHVNHFKIQTNTARGVRTIIDGLSRLIIERRYVDDVRRERQAHVPMARTTSMTSASLHSWPSPSHSHSFIFLGGITLFINKVIRDTKALRRT